MFHIIHYSMRICNIYLNYLSYILQDIHEYIYYLVKNNFPCNFNKFLLKNIFYIFCHIICKLIMNYQNINYFSIFRSTYYHVRNNFPCNFNKFLSKNMFNNYRHIHYKLIMNYQNINYFSIFHSTYYQKNDIILNKKYNYQVNYILNIYHYI